ncbi:molybdenum cofactor guanylyltransferase MobA [Phyllobacterium myrsinacearum]|uniref:Molybdenum cofactor guanylyltransferase n=1 Tax=Phyllobacterium myrsinacearum TaxID=28101 RepID=A0A839EEW8_9HYPH|nr:molybdopterin-guanine dinucleotide biosynthesis protein A [Phyllobacterium myrsinacearum]
MRIAGIILAGGRSSRMDGHDKALLPFGKARLIDFIVERLSSQLETMAINSNGDTAAFANLERPVIADSVSGFAGPLAGIIAGMQWAADAAVPFTHILTVATDTPFFPRDLVTRLGGAITGAPDHIAVAVSDAIWHPVFGLWPVAMRHDLQQWMHDPQNRRVRTWIESHPHHAVDFPLIETQAGAAFDPFFNINRPDDLALARSMITKLQNREPSP